MYEDVLASMQPTPKYNMNALTEMITHPHQDTLKYSGDERTIYLENLVFEDEYSILPHNIESFYRLTFKDCFFSTTKLGFISHVTCHNFITFENCYFAKGIFLMDNKFEKELCFKSMHSPEIHLQSGSHDKISLSGYDLNNIWIGGGTFTELNIGNYVADDNIGSLTIFSNPGELGNISISNKNIGSIHLSGTNKDKIFNFSKIKCDTISIVKFKNEGELNFYGIEPKNPQGDKRYFQIINSNLDGAEFYRANFSSYKELIIIDSFLVNTLFLGCRWDSNVRALFGPGYSDFTKSVEQGRKISPREDFLIKEAYRQLKISMEKHSDKILSNQFYAEEMKFHYKTLNWSYPWKNVFWDKLILNWSSIFSSFGQSFIKPLVSLLIGHLILLNLAILLGGFETLHISFSDPLSGFKEAFEKYFIYINPLRRLEVSLSGYLIVFDILMRVWSSYMIYNIIRASRRFIPS